MQTTSYYQTEHYNIVLMDNDGYNSKRRNSPYLQLLSVQMAIIEKETIIDLTDIMTYFKDFKRVIQYDNTRLFNLDDLNFNKLIELKLLIL